MRNPWAVPSLQIASINRTSALDSTVFLVIRHRRPNSCTTLKWIQLSRRGNRIYQFLLMEFRNEIVKTRYQPRPRLPITTNVDRSVHAGVELRQRLNRIRHPASATSPTHTIVSRLFCRGRGTTMIKLNPVGYQNSAMMARHLRFPDCIGMRLRSSHDRCI